MCRKLLLSAVETIYALQIAVIPITVIAAHCEFDKEKMVCK